MVPIPKPRNIPWSVVVRPQENTVNGSSIAKSINKPYSYSPFFGRVANDISYPHQNQG
jgi:hypothetical protein